MSTEQHCDNCTHMVEANAPGQIVKVKFCTRNPPVMIGTQQGLMSIQPAIPPTNICGEWKISHAAGLSNLERLGIKA